HSMCGGTSCLAPTSRGRIRPWRSRRDRGVRCGHRLSHCARSPLAECVAGKLLTMATSRGMAAYGGLALLGEVRDLRRRESPAPVEGRRACRSAQALDHRYRLAEPAIALSLFNPSRSEEHTSELQSL